MPHNCPFFKQNANAYGVAVDNRRPFPDDEIEQMSIDQAGNKVKSVLRTVPDGVSFRNTDKDVQTFNHLPFNEAPQDSLLYKLADYSYACPLTYHCGTGLTPYGYYLCPIAGGGIDRIFGLDLGRKKMPAPSDQMEEQRLAFCRLCGHFKVGKLFKKNGFSASWRKAYRLYQNEKPVLTLY